MYSNTAFRLEISGIYQKNTEVLNNPKGKPVHISLQYIVRIIFNYIKNRNHIKNKKSYSKQYLATKVQQSNYPTLPLQ